MSDVPYYAQKQPPAPPRVAKPGELLYEFVREADHARFVCELRDDGDYGIDAQIFQNEELLIVWRHATREGAIASATRERLTLERTPPLL